MPSQYLKRLLTAPQRSFFLFGPRGVGKSTWLRHELPDALHVDLLRSNTFLDLERSPDLLEAMVAPLPPGGWVIVDEVQKVPQILDEVHRLSESREVRFALCGSSARKLRRGGVNLLGGRASTRHMEAFVKSELGDAFELESALEWGTLPYVVRDRTEAADILSSYVETYLKEEIRAEGLTRSVQPFVRFLAVAGRLNAKVLNVANVAREAGVPRNTVETYFTILLDTLVGHLLPAYRPRAKVREQSHPKFYWFDPGVARGAAGLVREPAERAWKGDALETLVYHEIRVRNEAGGNHRPVAYYQVPSGDEIDFIVETRPAGSDTPPAVILIEVKLAERWNRRWEGPMHRLKQTGALEVQRMIGLYTGDSALRFDGVDVLPVGRFLDELHSGGVF